MTFGVLGQTNCLNSMRICFHYAYELGWVFANWLKSEKVKSATKKNCEYLDKFQKKCLKRIFSLLKDFACLAGKTHIMAFLRGV